MIQDELNNLIDKFVNKIGLLPDDFNFELMGWKKTLSKQIVIEKLLETKSCFDNFFVEDESGAIVYDPILTDVIKEKQMTPLIAKISEDLEKLIKLHEEGLIKFS